jgi:pseudaminic acid cytidylyltransferase
MTAPPSVLCIIPARGGSKRIPRKSIRLFRGKPMLSWSVEAALASGSFDTVMASTDDAEIAEVAHAVGAEVGLGRNPTAFLRPKPEGTEA